MQQLKLAIDGLEEASLYHEADSRSFLAVCTQEANGKFTQWCVKPNGLPDYLALIEPGDRMNVWLSQGEFAGPNRRIVNLTRMGLCFLDLDTYKSPAKNWPRQQVIAKINELCAIAGIPSPSLIIFSGQGYQIKWLLSSYLPRQALVRWNIVQERLVDLFKPLGADPSAKDAARILRMPGTINLKTGKRVEIVHFRGRSIDTTTAVDFEDLARVFLPLNRLGKAVKADKRAEAAESTPFQLVADNPGFKNQALKQINTRILAWDRLHDLRKLAEMRGGIREGMRNSFLLVVACQMALSGLIYPQNFKSEVRVLQEEISKDGKWLRDRNLLVTLQDRVNKHHSNEKVDFNGKAVTPIYTYRTATIIQLLEITPEEQRKLKTLISTDMAKERNTLRERSKRRAAGVVERKEYIEQHKQTAAQRRQQILEMHAQGMKPMQIMAELNISRAVVTRAIAQR